MFDLFGCASDTHTGRIELRLTLHLSQSFDRISVGCLQTCLISIALWNIGYHENGIDPSLFHEGQIHLSSLLVPDVERTGEDHGGIGMGVDGQDSLVDRFGLSEPSGCIHMPAEECFHLLVSIGRHGFRMPLHA